MEEQTSNTIRPVIEPLLRGKFWMQLIGVILIIHGLLTALSIIGLVVAWIPIWAGIVLMQAASAIQRAHDSDDQGEATKAMGKLKLYFTIFGVLTLIILIFMIVSIVFGLGMGMMGMEAMSDMQP